MESQNIAFSFDVFNDHSVVSGLTIDTRYYKVYLVSAATSDAAGGSWGVTFTETGGKFADTIRHIDYILQMCTTSRCGWVITCRRVSWDTWLWH